MRNRLNRWWEKPERGALKRGYRHRVPLVDVYTPDYVRVWLAFDSKYDYDIERVASDSIGLEGPPEWYDCDVAETGWDSILGMYNHWPEDWSRQLGWMLCHGIAPGQPFLVHLERPRWYKSSYEYDEWDCDFDWDILRVVPLRRPANVMKVWERALKREKEGRAFTKRRLAALSCLRRTEVKSMYLRGESYFAGSQRYWDEMEMPRGWRVSLCSDAALPKEPRGSMRLVSGEDDDGDHARALSALVEKAMKELPGLSEETIRKLPQRYY